MAQYEYAGPGPHEDEELGLVRPGDRREFGQEPAWGPWRLIEPEPDAESDSKPSGTPPPAPASASPAPSGSVPAMTNIATPPKEM